MDHAEVLERIESAVGAPGGLARLGADPAPVAADLRAHVAGCPPCAAEWRAWSVVSLGLAAAAPDTLEPRPGLRDQVLAAAAAGPSAATSRGAASVSSAPGGTSRSGTALGLRRPRTSPTPEPKPHLPPSRPPYRLLLLSAAAVLVLFMAGLALGRSLAPAPEAPRGDPGRVLREAALILQETGYRLARLETLEGDAGGVVVVSPAGRLAVVSSVLDAPPEGTRYVCLLDRQGELTQVGYMRWEPTAAGGGLAYWAGDADPVDLGMPGDVFIVQLDTPDAQPTLTGEFLG